MDKDQCLTLLALVNDKSAMQLLEAYAKARIEIRRDQLEKTFKNYGALSRKQIQWSLKKRGYYNYSQA